MDNDMPEIKESGAFEYQVATRSAKGSDKKFECESKYI